jgi:hypothetical protein
MNGHGRAALGLARRGLAVFPLRPGTKEPMTKNGFKSATKDSSKVADWWRMHPEANVGVATGRVSGIVVVDVDDVDALVGLVDRLGPLPQTLAVRTPRGGMHFWLRDEGRRFACSVGKLAPGIDVRGDGGYVVAPPSVSAFGGAWTWRTDGVTPAPAPAEWAIAMSSPVARTNGTTWSPVSPRPTEDWIAMLRGPIREGARNDSLTQLTGHLLRRYVDVYVVHELIVMVNAARCSPPLPEREVERIVDSVSAIEKRRRDRRG